MKQFIITPAAGKRLIARGLASHSEIRTALESGIVAIIAGTTNGYVAEELLAQIGQEEGFSRERFFRGVTLPPSQPKTENGRIADTSQFPGDVIITKGIWQKGKTIFDVIDELKEGDIILKGANALDLSRRRAAVLIGDPKAGTIGVTMQAVIGRRVRLILPVGLEKRVSGDLDILAAKLNAPGAEGPRLWPVPGQVFTEIDAIKLLTGSTAELIAGGGVYGAEGSIRLAVRGEMKQLEAAIFLIKLIAEEPAFEL
ncbi:MAG: hypothetical protein ABIJ37_10050 [Pseudomonadota bacterium]